MDSLWLYLLDNEINRLLGEYRLAARKKIDTHGAVFRPGMSGEMALGNHHHSR
jgi:hypothetical protein